MLRKELQRQFRHTQGRYGISRPLRSFRENPLFLNASAASANACAGASDTFTANAAGDDAIAGLFHKDAVLLPAYENDERYEGRDAVKGWHANYDNALRADVRFLRHKIGPPVIEVSGNEATSNCYLDANAITKSTDKPMVVFGRYDDKFIKDEGALLRR